MVNLDWLGNLQANPASFGTHKKAMMFIGLPALSYMPTISGQSHPIGRFKPVPYLYNGRSPNKQENKTVSQHPQLNMGLVFFKVGPPKMVDFPWVSL